MADRQVTLRNIARKAKVSVATVSYALHGKGRMTPKTRSHLEQMLKNAGYRPSYKLRPVLYITSHRTLGDMHGLAPMLLKYEGINACLRAQDVQLRLELIDLPAAPELHEQLQQLLALRPSGVLLDAELGDRMEPVADCFEKQQVPVVQLGHVALASIGDCVVVDCFGGAQAGTQHLIAQGHQRIATIRWNVERDPASRQKHAGFKCAMDEAGLKVRPEYIVAAPIGKTAKGQPGRIAIKQLLDLPEPPTAVFVENSFVSPSLIYPIPPERAIPKRIAELEMVHFEAWSLDWLEQVAFGKLNLPPRHVKLLRVDWPQMGRAAAERILAKLENEDPPNRTIRLAPHLVLASGSNDQPLD